MRKLALCFISAAVTIATTTSVFAASPWYKDDGKWRYIQNGRRFAQDEWVNDNGSWYYIDQLGFMSTGWKDLRNLVLLR